MKLIIEINELDKKRADLGMPMHPYRIDKINDAIRNGTPQRSKGKWISHREHCEKLGVMPSGLGAYEWCSNCDCGIDVIEWHRNPYNYCPNCGAEMNGGGEDEDSVCKDCYYNNGEAHAECVICEKDRSR